MCRTLPLQTTECSTRGCCSRDTPLTSFWRGLGRCRTTASCIRRCGGVLSSVKLAKQAKPVKVVGQKKALLPRRILLPATLCRELEQRRTCQVATPPRLAVVPRQRTSPTTTAGVLATSRGFGPLFGSSPGLTGVRGEV